MDNKAEVETQIGDGTFASRMNAVAEEARESKLLSMKQKEKAKIFITDDEREVARAVMYLMDNEAFKIYLQYEAKEEGDRFVRAFEDVPDEVLKNGSFGEKMAFNKGRSYQMGHFRRIRENLVSKYLTSAKLEKETQK